jgi:NAD(P)-dependent dehydrogenase (short-subunit alcohol dehydrogenase family)
MNGLLDGKVAFVTGSATGLGRAIVEAFAEAGANGFGFDVVEDAEPLPQGWIAINGDVSNEENIAAALARVRDEFGRVDSVVANAGLVPSWSETESIELDEWDRVFAVNVRGVIATIKNSVPLMQDNGGSIIAMGSLNSRRAHGSQCLYTASKHAVLGIVRATALDVGRYGIRVNAVGPGPVATDALLSRLRLRAEQGEPPPETVLERFAADTALRRMATAGDVARATVFLASDLSSGVTGQILPVDAGLA